MLVEKLLNSYSGKVKEVEIGSGGLKVGGETCLPFYLWEGEMPNKILFGLEILDQEPVDWADSLARLYQDVWKEPVEWAKKCFEMGAEFLHIRLTGTHPDSKKHDPTQAADLVEEISKAVSLPLIVYVSGNKETDAQVLQKVADRIKDSRLLLGPADEENYKLVVAPVSLTNHNVIAFSPVDINIAKQVNILIAQMGMPLERIVMDPTTGALGYGLEYTFSIMERLRLAALIQNDEMTQFPIICTVGQETWKTKEAKVSPDEEPTWGDEEKRGISWEVVTAITLMLAGANLISLRHPESLRLLKEARSEFISLGEGG